MNFSVWAWIAFAVLVVAPFVTGVFGWYFGLVEGEHRGRCSERERQLERERRKAEAALGPPPDIRAKTGPLVRSGQPGKNMGDGVGLAGFRAAKSPVSPRPDHISAAHIRRVVVPLPGTPVRPQPAPDPEPATRGLPALTDTGEIRALSTVTDAWLEGMRRKGLIT